MPMLWLLQKAPSRKPVSLQAMQAFKNASPLLKPAPPPRQPNPHRLQSPRPNQRLPRRRHLRLHLSLRQHLSLFQKQRPSPPQRLKQLLPLNQHRPK